EALIENIHREDLGPIELAEAFRELLDDLGATQEQLAERLGMSRPHIAKTLRLLQLPAEVQELVGEGKLSAGHARALLGLDDPASMAALALRMIAEDLSVRQVEEAVRGFHDGAARPPQVGEPPAPRTDGRFGEVEEILSEQLQTRVRVEMGRRRGRIVVEFGSPDDLDRIVAEIVHAGEA